MGIEVGDRITIFGGYYEPPRWLAGRDTVAGTVLAWMPGNGASPGCLVALDEPLEAEGDSGGEHVRFSGRFLVLQLRHRGQEWDDSGTVHVEVCEAQPEAKPWGERPKGAWVESHAWYSKA